MLEELVLRKKALIDALDAEEKAGQAVLKTILDLKNSVEKKKNDGCDEKYAQQVTETTKSLQNALKGVGAVGVKIKKECDLLLEMVENVKKVKKSCTETSQGGTKKDEGGGKKKINASVLGLLPLPKLLSLLQENIDQDNETAGAILDRLQKCTVTLESVKSTGGGKIIAKLSKHQSSTIKNKAIKVQKAWKASLVAQKKKNEELQKSNKPRISEDERKAKLDKTGEKLAMQRQELLERKKSSGVRLIDEHEERRMAEEKRRIEEEKAKRQRAKKKKKRERRDQDNSSDDEVGDEWMEQYQKKLQKGYARIQAEEEYSAAVGEREDYEAELEERRRRKKARRD